MVTRDIVYITTFQFYLLIILCSVSVPHTVAVSREASGEGSGGGITRTIIKVSTEEGNDSIDCLSGLIPCKSLEYVSRGTNNSDIVISVGVHVILRSPESQVKSANNSVTFYNAFDVALIGSGDPWSSTSYNKTIVKCYGTPSSAFNNLVFLNPYNVTVANIIFEGCGMISSAVFAKNAKLFHIDNCIFANSTGGAVFLYNPMNVSITNLLLLNNSGQIYDDTPINDEYGFNVNQSNAGIGIVYTKIMHPVLTIENCTFDSNHALMDQLNINDTRPSDYKPFGTGGGLLIRFSNTSHSQLVIADCKFINNTALVRGGGLYVAFWGHSKYNSIEIQNSLFQENYCAKAGGAISLSSFSSSHGNVITIAGSNFTENEAVESCGAMVYRFSNELIPDEVGHLFSNEIRIQRYDIM